MACNCGKNKRTTSSVTSAPRTSARAAAAGAAPMYEVLTASGSSTGRQFTSLVAASSFARRIGGSTRPVG